MADDALTAVFAAPREAARPCHSSAWALPQYRAGRRRASHAFPAHKMAKPSSRCATTKRSAKPSCFKPAAASKSTPNSKTTKKASSNPPVPRQLPPRRRRGHGLLHVHAARESGGRPSLSREHGSRLDAHREAEILSQVKDAFIQGNARSRSGDAAFALPRSDQRRQRSAFANRYRRQSVSIATAAVNFAIAHVAICAARRSSSSARENGSLVARRLKAEGCSEIVVINRTHQRARDVVDAIAWSCDGFARHRRHAGQRRYRRDVNRRIGIRADDAKRR